MVKGEAGKGNRGKLGGVETGGGGGQGANRCLLAAAHGRGTLEI